MLDRLAQVGLVDDADFAEQWVRSRRVNAGKGKRALAAELRTKGVDNDVITAALAGIDAGAERERAEQLVRDKLRREKLGDDDDTKVMRRLVGMLARRGYSQSMAFDVVKANWPASGSAAGSNLRSPPPPFGCPSVFVVRFMLASRVGSSGATGGRRGR